MNFESLDYEQLLALREIVDGLSGKAFGIIALYFLYRLLLAVLLAL